MGACIRTMIITIPLVNTSFPPSICSVASSPYVLLSLFSLWARLANSRAYGLDVQIRDFTNQNKLSINGQHERVKSAANSFA